MDSNKSIESSSSPPLKPKLPIFKAIEDGSYDEFRRLFEDEYTNVLDTLFDESGEQGDSLLLHACRYSRKNVVEFLVERKADVNSVNRLGGSALYLCAQEGHAELVSLLVDAGAIIEYEYKNDGITPLYIAAQNNNVLVVQELVARGANVNPQDSEGASAVYIAAQHGHNEVLHCLLDKGADVNLTRKSGFPPIGVASECGHAATVRLLCQRGAHLNQANQHGTTACFMAAQMGNLACLRVLVEYGADLHLSKNDGASPLFIACQKGHDKVVEFLLQSGALVNGCKNDGASPLIVSVYNGHVEVTRMLLEWGADVALEFAEKSTLEWICQKPVALEANRSIIEAVLDEFILKRRLAMQLYRSLLHVFQSLRGSPTLCIFHILLLIAESLVIDGTLVLRVNLSEAERVRLATAAFVGVEARRRRSPPQNNVAELSAWLLRTNYAFSDLYPFGKN